MIAYFIFVFLGAFESEGYKDISQEFPPLPRSVCLLFVGLKETWRINVLRRGS